MTAPLNALRWQARLFRELDAGTLYALLKLRSEVFVVEQQCVYLDPDGKDTHPDTVHVFATDDDGAIAAYLRILAPGLSYPQVSFGRVLTAPAWRGRGLGDPLVHQALAQIQARWPGCDVQIGAQAHLQHYYARHGFVPSSEPYLDDGIAHIDMLRAAGASA
ncbi:MULTISPECIES: GNAT family N-acetyltransferase [unclassified Lysobacter]|uniref:GNAT family N-acetyltransferase n=1 Tax=unclassified Lysobacter TaxID=2635362 RepID=UPI001C22E95A|nr:GNAT family N-acetyltransferase [Lysobacter sp. MMG2]MBU8975948.1 GNAT family N-acetyltransferase [Lysobacter sp. MMG2]